MKAIQKRSELERPERFISPAVDIKDEGDEIVLWAELPGVDKNNLNIQIENNILTIDARKDDKMDGYKLLISERAQHRFKRVFELDESIDQSDITASMQNGILTLRLKKAQHAKPKRIEVN